MLRIRRVDSALWRSRVYALRYRAYRQSQAIPVNAMASFSDSFDDQANHILWALTEDDRVVGSIRVTWHEPGSSLLIPEQLGYESALRDVVTPKTSLFSGNRFVTDPSIGGTGSQLALLLLRYLVLTFFHGRCEWALAAVRAHHVPFYRRVLRLRQISDARNYPGLNAPMYLTACRFPAEIDRVYRSQPSLRPNDDDRIFFSEESRDLWEQGLPVSG